MLSMTNIDLDAFRPTHDICQIDNLNDKTARHNM